MSFQGGSDWDEWLRAASAEPDHDDSEVDEDNERTIARENKQLELITKKVESGERVVTYDASESEQDSPAQPPKVRTSGTERFGCRWSCYTRDDNPAFREPRTIFSFL